MTGTATETRRGVRTRAIAPVVGLAGWGLLVALAVSFGRDLARTRNVRVGAAPVVGTWDWHLDASFVAPVVVGVAVVAAGPTLARRAPWVALLVGVTVVGAGWATALAATEGLSSVPEPLETRYEYLAVLPVVDDIGVGEFVESFSDTEVLGEYPTHVKGHPVGAPLIFHALERIGLGGPGWATALVIGAGASAGAAALVALRDVAGETTARAAAPFLCVLPAAVWQATSADALFAGVTAWGIVAVVVATRAAGWRRALLALAGGAVLGIALHLSYGTVPLLLVVAVVVIGRRAWGAVVAAVMGAVAVTFAFVGAGFWWFDGLDATRVFYEAGVSQRRPYGYFVLLGNPAAFALALGPVVVAALAGLRDRRTLLLVGSALAAVLVADVSGLSKGEVERIWLPFVPWVALATADLDRRWARPGLALQAAAGVGLQAWLFSPW